MKIKNPNILINIILGNLLAEKEGLVPLFLLCFIFFIFLF